jgi:Protein of unknown function (DUF732)
VPGVTTKPFHFTILHISAALNPHTDGIVDAKRTEAHQMPSPRWLARLTVPMMVGAALVTNAAIATADPTNDAYLAQLRALGFTWPPEHDDGLIGMAYIICDELKWGWTPDQIAQDLHSILDQRSVHFGQVTSMVSLAHATYCPG